MIDFHRLLAVAVEDALDAYADCSAEGMKLSGTVAEFVSNFVLDAKVPEFCPDCEGMWQCPHEFAPTVAHLLKWGGFVQRIGNAANKRFQ